jgi:hypothetical protein
MRTLSIIPDAGAFQLVETVSGKVCNKIIARFPTEAWAQKWLENHLRVLNMVSLVAWMRMSSEGSLTRQPTSVDPPL